MDNGFRWLTVGPKAQPDLEIALMKLMPGPHLDAEGVELLQKLMAKADGSPGRRGTGENRMGAIRWRRWSLFALAERHRQRRGQTYQQRYRYTLWRPNPLVRFKLSLEEAYPELARRFFNWMGPATLQEFQWFSALGVKAAKPAVAPLKLSSVAPGDPRLMLAQDLDQFRSFKPPKTLQYALVSGLDVIVLLRRDMLSLVDVWNCFGKKNNLQVRGSSTQTPGRPADGEKRPSTPQFAAKRFLLRYP